MVRLVTGVVGAAVFLLSVAVQFNDPDPALWIGIYGAAAAVCIAHVSIGAAASDTALVRLAGVATLTATIAGVWALTLAPQALHWLQGDAAAVAFTMKTGDVAEEVARECGGLTIVCGWCAAIAVFAQVRRQPSADSTTARR